MKTTESIYTTVRNNITDLRKKRRYSQKEIASILGITQSAYNRIENGIIQISVEQVHLLALFYQLSVDHLYCKANCAILPNTQQQKDAENMRQLESTNMLLKKLLLELEEKIVRQHDEINLLRNQLSEYRTSTLSA